MDKDEKKLNKLKRILGDQWIPNLGLSNNPYLTAMNKQVELLVEIGPRYCKFFLNNKERIALYTCVLVQRSEI